MLEVAVIPDYEAIMWPLLQFLSDGHTRSMQECRENLSVHFALSEDELAELLPSGRVPIFNSRVHWAKTYLVKAGALESQARGFVRIAERGRALLAEGLGGLKTRDLNSRFEEMREWTEASRLGTSSGRSTPEPDLGENDLQNLPPNESLDASFRRYRESVQSDVLERIKRMPPAFFERLVVDLLLRLGYGGPFGTGITLGRSGDHGVDGVIHQDKLGLDLLYVQAKRWDGVVGGSVIREFAGALSAHRAGKGVIITTSGFSRDAIVDAERMGQRIVLIDGAKLAELLYETGLGLVTDATFEIKRLDSDYFEGE